MNMRMRQVCVLAFVDMSGCIPEKNMSTTATQPIIYDQEKRQLP